MCINWWAEKWKQQNIQVLGFHNVTFPFALKQFSGWIIYSGFIPVHVHYNVGVQSSSKDIHDDLALLQQVNCTVHVHVYSRNWYTPNMKSTVVVQLVQNLEQELQDYEQTSGYAFPVQKPMNMQVSVLNSLS